MVINAWMFCSGKSDTVKKDTSLRLLHTLLKLTYALGGFPEDDKKMSQISISSSEYRSSSSIVMICNSNIIINICIYMHYVFKEQHNWVYAGAYRIILSTPDLGCVKSQNGNITHSKEW